MQIEVMFGEYKPDIPSLKGDTQLARNVIPSEASYRPLKGLSEYSGALDSRCMGAYAAKSGAGVVTVFAGTATKLYTLTGSSTSWVDATRLAGGDYAATARWNFTQFGDYVQAWNGVDAVQEYQLGTSTDFAAMSGSPPIAKYATVANQQIIVGNVAGGMSNRLQFCGVDARTTWGTSATAQSDFSDLVGDGVTIKAVVGRTSPHIWCERKIFVMTFVGPPLVYDIAEIESQRGTIFPQSVVGYGPFSFGFCQDGPYSFNGQTLSPIGQGKFADTVMADFAQSNADRMSAAIDPVNRCVVWGYPSSDSVNGTPDRLLFFHWPTGKASLCNVMHEVLTSSSASFGFTLEQLANVSSSLDSLPASLDSELWTASGRTLLGAFSTNHKLGYFTGANLAAKIRTGEAQIFPGRKSLITRARPLVQGMSATMTVTPITRDKQHVAAATGTAGTVNGNGFAPLRAKARYLQADLDIAAGGTWDHAEGIQFEAIPAGARP